MSWTCLHCGYVNEDDNQYCLRCGAFISDARDFIEEPNNEEFDETLDLMHLMKIMIVRMRIISKRG